MSSIAIIFSDMPGSRDELIMTTLATTHEDLRHVSAHGRTDTAVRGHVAVWIDRWIDRWIDNFQVRQHERALNYLMELDPRMRAEVEGAVVRTHADY